MTEIHAYAGDAATYGLSPRTHNPAQLALLQLMCQDWVTRATLEEGQNVPYRVVQEIDMQIPKTYKEFRSWVSQKNIPSGFSILLVYGSEGDFDVAREVLSVAAENWDDIIYR